MDRARGEFEAAGARLVLIGQATPRHAAHFRSRLGIHAPVLADERRVSYEAVGAKVGGIGELLGPKVIAKGAATMLRSRQVQGRTIGNPAQLGGAAVIVPGDEIAWARVARDAADNATPAEILAAIAGPRS